MLYEGKFRLKNTAKLVATKRQPCFAGRHKVVGRLGGVPPPCIANINEGTVQHMAVNLELSFQCG